MLETMPLPDLPARFAHAATGIRRSSPCAAAAFCERASQVITKPGVGTHVPPSFLPLEFLPGCTAPLVNWALKMPWSHLLLVPCARLIREDDLVVPGLSRPTYPLLLPLPNEPRLLISDETAGDHGLRLTTAMGGEAEVRRLGSGGALFGAAGVALVDRKTAASSLSASRDAID